MTRRSRVSLTVLFAVLLSVALPGGLLSATGSILSKHANGARAITIAASSATVSIRIEGEGQKKDPSVRSPGAMLTTFDNHLRPLQDTLSGADGFATAVSSLKASVHTTPNGETVVTSVGAVRAKAELRACANPPCHADRSPSAQADALVFVNFEGTGTYAYKLEMDLATDGTAATQCATVTTKLLGGPNLLRGLDLQAVGGAPGCRAPHARVVTRRGTFHMTADDGEIYLMGGRACCLDPSTARTDTLHGDWEVTLTVGPKCPAQGACPRVR